MKYFQKLIWEKIYLSPLNPDDFEIVTKWMNDMEITNLTEIMPETFWLYQWKARFDELVKWKYFQNYPFAIIKKRWDKFIWTIWLYELDFIGQSAEVMRYGTPQQAKGNGSSEKDTKEAAVRFAAVFFAADNHLGEKEIALFKRLEA